MTNVRADDALQVALAYHHAWAGGDFDAAMTYIAPDIRCQAPAGTISGADAFRAFMGPFVSMVRTARVVAAFGDTETVLLMYDTDTALVSDAPGAEWHTVVDGRIVAMRIIFDQLPFDQARRDRDLS